MKINLWYCKTMQEWRWTLCEDVKDGSASYTQESGSRIYLRDAMNDIANTVEYVLECKQR